MTTTPLPRAATPPALAFPTVRIGGLFVTLLGVSMLLATALGDSLPVQPGIFALGALFGVAGVLLNKRARKRLAFGEQTARQRAAVRLALALEAILVPAVVFLIPGDLRTHWLLVLGAVGLHFGVFSVVHGPRMLLLSLLCCVNAAAGLLLPNVPFEVFGLTDGLVKVALGSSMALTRPPMA